MAPPPRNTRDAPTAPGGQGHTELNGTRTLIIGGSPSASRAPARPPAPRRAAPRRGGASPGTELGQSPGASARQDQDDPEPSWVPSKITPDKITCVILSDRQAANLFITLRIDILHVPPHAVSTWPPPSRARAHARTLSPVRGRQGVGLQHTEPQSVALRCAGRCWGSRTTSTGKTGASRKRPGLHLAANARCRLVLVGRLLRGQVALVIRGVLRVFGPRG